MASTFAELYGDYLDSIKQYSQKLDVTPMQFLRAYTRGMQHFQRETEYIEHAAKVLPDPTTGDFFLPTDLWRLEQIKDSNNLTLIPQSPDQFEETVERDVNTGLTEVPSRRSWFTRNDKTPMRYYTIYERTIRPNILYPATDTYFHIRYIPDLHAFSRNSAQWAPFFVDDNAFQTQFETTGVTPALAPFENAFTDYAIAQFIKSQGSVNYKVFEISYMQEVEKAKLVKPTYFTEGKADYQFPFAYVTYRKMGY